MEKSHAYIRVSSSGQADGVSPEAQISAAIDYRREYIQNVPWCSDSFASPNKGFFIDLAVSAWNKKTAWIRNRPGGSALMDSLKRGDHVIFYSVDRGFRNVASFGLFLDWCLENGINSHFIKEMLDLSSPSGRLRAHIYAAMAEYYSSILSLRLREAFAIRGTKKTAIPRQKRTRLWDYSSVNFVEKKKPKVEECKPGRVFLYGRVSDKKQVDSMLGLNFQESRLNKFFDRLKDKNGLLEKYSEPMLDKGVSAFSSTFRDRPLGREIMQEAKKGDHVVALRFDRIFRSVRDMDRTVDEFRERGITLHMIDEKVRTDDKASMLYMNMLVSVAQMESELRSMRQHEVNKKMREKGLPLNQFVPHGTKVVSRLGKKVLIPNFEELVDMYSAYVLVKERGWSTTQSGFYMRALRAHKRNEKSTYKHDLKNSEIWIHRMFPAFFKVFDGLPETARENIRNESARQLSIELSAESLKRVCFDLNKACNVARQRRREVHGV